MAQTVEGARKIAAKLAGISFEQYLLEIAEGRKWCTLCRAFHLVSEFASDRSRGDGFTASCRDSRNAWNRRRYAPRPRRPQVQLGAPFVAPRDDDKIQARGRINYLVRAGVMPHPDTLPCKDCGHQRRGPGDRRHHYDHHLGYAPEHHEDVEPVCTKCHGARGWKRGEFVASVPHLRAGADAKAANKKTHCAKGHPMSRHRDGKWRCRTCRLEYWRKRNLSNG